VHRSRKRPARSSRANASARDSVERPAERDAAIRDDIIPRIWNGSSCVRACSLHDEKERKEKGRERERERKRRSLDRLRLSTRTFTVVVARGRVRSPRERVRWAKPRQKRARARARARGALAFHCPSRCGCTFSAECAIKQGRWIQKRCRSSRFSLSLIERGDYVPAARHASTN